MARIITREDDMSYFRTLYKYTAMLQPRDNFTFRWQMMALVNKYAYKEDIEKATAQSKMKREPGALIDEPEPEVKRRITLNSVSIAGPSDSRNIDVKPNLVKAIGTNNDLRDDNHFDEKKVFPNQPSISQRVIRKMKAEAPKLKAEAQESNLRLFKQPHLLDTIELSDDSDVEY